MTLSKYPIICAVAFVAATMLLIIPSIAVLEGNFIANAQMPPPPHATAIASQQASSTNGTRDFTNVSPSIVFAESTDHVYVIWTETKIHISNQNQTPPTQHQSSALYYRVSSDRGASFGKPVLLFDFSQHAAPLVVTGSARNGSMAYVAWIQNKSLDQFDLYFTKTTPNGSAFDTPSIIASDHFNASAGNNGGQYGSYATGLPQIVASENYVYIMWTDEITRITSQGGPIFAPNGTIGNQPEFGGTIIRNGSATTENTSPSGQTITGYKYPIMSSSSHTYIIASHDDGTTFDEKVSLVNQSYTNNGTKFHPTSIPPKMAATGNSVYITSSESSINGSAGSRVNLVLTLSHDGGKSFEKKQVPIQGYEKDNEYPVLSVPFTPPMRTAVNANNNTTSASQATPLYLLTTIMENDSNAATQPAKVNGIPIPLPFNSALRPHDLVLRSVDEGTTFDKPVEVSNSSSNFFVPAIDVSDDGKTVYYAWSDYGKQQPNGLPLGLFNPFEPFSQLENSTAGSVMVASDNGTVFHAPVRLTGSQGMFNRFEFGYGAPSDVILLHIGNNSLVVLKETGQFVATSGTTPNQNVSIWTSNDKGLTFTGPRQVVEPSNSRMVSATISSWTGKDSSPSLFILWAGNNGSIYLESLPLLRSQ